MRTLPYRLHLPETVAEAVALHATTPGALYVAGGTDLMPNMKQRLYDTGDLISLSRLDLGGVAVDDDGSLRLGAGCVLADLADDPLLRQQLPVLADTVLLIAGPLHRNRATLGGNVMLDTRCLFYNQTEAWRQALGHCLKKDGDWCHVIGSDRRCVATRSSDSAPVLVALDATLRLQTSDGPQSLPIRELYGVDGRVDQHLKVAPSALLVEIVVPPPAHGRRLATYRKVRTRQAIDFPQLGLAVVIEEADGQVAAATAVLSALMPAPRLVRGMEAAVGTALEDAVVDSLAASAAKQAKAQVSVQGSPAWRKEMAAVELRRALVELRERL